MGSRDEIRVKTTLSVEVTITVEISDDGEVFEMVRVSLPNHKRLLELAEEQANTNVDEAVAEYVAKVREDSDDDEG